MINTKLHLPACALISDTSHWKSFKTTRQTRTLGILYKACVSLRNKCVYSFTHILYKDFKNSIPQSLLSSCVCRIWGRCECVYELAPGTLGIGGCRTRWWLGSSLLVAWRWAPSGPDFHLQTTVQTSGSKRGNGSKFEWLKANERQ